MTFLREYSSSGEILIIVCLTFLDTGALLNPYTVHVLYNLCFTISGRKDCDSIWESVMTLEVECMTGTIT